MERSPQGPVGPEPLIDAHPQSGEMVVRNFDYPESYVDFNEARIHRLNVLSLFSAVNQQEHFYTTQQAEAEDRYGDNAAQVLAGSRRKRDEMVREAEDRFYQSIGLYVTEATALQFPGFNIDDYRRDARRQWQLFQARYRSENRRHQRNQYRNQLLEGWTPSDINRGQTLFNRQHNLRPYISESDQKAAAKQGNLYPLLTTPERLVAIHEDPRAGFLPTTNLEKNMVMTYLDYLDNPNYPLRVTNQLFEVFIHQQQLDKPKPGDTPEQRALKRQRAQERRGLHMATRALESITYEMGDFMHNAQESLSALQGLKEFLDEGHNPRVTIDEEVPLTNLGLRALIRHRDLAQYRDTNKLPVGLADPLRTKENRIRKESERLPTDIGSNKTIEDLYTRTTMDETMEAYIAEQAVAMTIREARQVVRAAILDQQSRMMFYRRELTGVYNLAPEVSAITIRSIAGQLLGKVA